MNGVSNNHNMVCNETLNQTRPFQFSTPDYNNTALSKG